MSILILPPTGGERTALNSRLLGWQDKAFRNIDASGRLSSEKNAIAASLSAVDAPMPLDTPVTGATVASRFLNPLTMNSSAGMGCAQVREPAPPTSYLNEPSLSIEFKDFFCNPAENTPRYSEELTAIAERLDRVTVVQVTGLSGTELDALTDFDA